MDNCWQGYWKGRMMVNTVLEIKWTSDLTVYHPKILPPPLKQSEAQLKKVRAYKKHKCRGEVSERASEWRPSRKNILGVLIFANLGFLRAKSRSEIAPKSLQVINQNIKLLLLSSRVASHLLISLVPQTLLCWRMGLSGSGNTGWGSGMGGLRHGGMGVGGMRRVGKVVEKVEKKGMVVGKYDGGRRVAEWR